MRAVTDHQIREKVKQFLRSDDTANLTSRRRERSWDLCYQHFATHERPTEQLELSCLHLGYYLASWGMLRGSSFLFRETNLLHYIPAIEAIEKHNPTLRGIDADRYSDPVTIEAMWAAWRDLNSALLPDGGRATTLISKVMMGVWGCLPSFDTFFMRTFKDLAADRTERRAFSDATPSAVKLLGAFYDEHATVIEALRNEHPVIGFPDGQPTNVRMPRAKIIDIYGFQSSWG